MNRLARSFLLVLAWLALPGIAAGATKVWNNAAGGNWSTASNWTGGLPGPGDDVDITLAGTYTVTLDTNTFRLGSLVLGGASGTQTLAIAANSLQIRSPSGGVVTVNTNGVILLSSGGSIDLTRDDLIPSGPNALRNFGTIINAGGTAGILAAEAGVRNEVGGKIDVQSGTLVFVGGFFLEAGTLYNAGTLTIGSSTDPGLAFGRFSFLVNTGAVLVNGKSLHIDLGGHFEQSAGVTDLGAPSGTLFNNGSEFSVTGGIVTGNGTILSSTDVLLSGSATLAPGASPGRISFHGAYQQNAGAFAVELNGTDPGVTYDQVVTDAAPTLGGVLNVSLGFAPALGTTFVVVDNKSTDAIAGTFAGLPEGATLTTGATKLQISYVGGTGNDVTLTVVSGAAGATSTALTVAPNPSALGQYVTLAATVTGVAPTGTVQFKDGAANLGAPITLVAGVASLTTNSLAVASHAIAATYSGDAANLSSTSTAVIQVVDAPGPAAEQVPALRDSVLALLALLLAMTGSHLVRRR